MIEGLGLLVRGLHTACAVLVFGSLIVLHLAPQADPRLLRWRTGWLRAVLLLSVGGLILGFGVLGLQVFAVESAAPWHTVARRLLLESRFGAVWMAREALTLGVCLALVVALLGPAGTVATVPAMLLSGVALAAAPLSGHSAAEEPAWPMLTVHGVHLVAAGAWWGALPALATFVGGTRVQGATAVAAELFQRFSSAAIGLMAAIVGSGLLLGVTHVERWPALLATDYGHLLLLKVLLLLGVLVMAAKLRWRLLPALTSEYNDGVTKDIGRWVFAEFLVAGVLVLVATQLGQTVPARHDAIEWWAPFRFSIDATWDLESTALRAWSGAALALLAAALAGLAALGRVRRRRALAGATALLASAAAVALPAITVQAFPDTYRKPSVPYQTISVAAGADLFAVHCNGCHGRSGHGDGPQAKGLALPPADLTEPHTALHTAGDIFWWLTHGKPPGVMSGLEDRLSEDDRWDLINFLRTLSSGYQARVIAERVVPGRPWLPAVDFSYVTADGRAGTLKDFRESSVVLLVFLRAGVAQPRLTHLADLYPRLRSAGGEILAVPVDDGAPPSGLPFPVVAEGATETARTYALLRRTLSNLDARDQQPMPEHMELLVDRFGYVRARWLPAEGEGWRDLESLLQQIALLVREPEILPPPDDHVH